MIFGKKYNIETELNFTIRELVDLEWAGLTTLEYIVFDGPYMTLEYPNKQRISNSTLERICNMYDVTIDGDLMSNKYQSILPK